MSFSISSFSGPYRFLSNFFIEPDLTHVEGEYQAAKCFLPADAAHLSQLAAPEVAKRLGQHVRMRDDWEQVKVSVMRSLVLQKFTDHEGLRKKLLETGQAELIEGNIWGDTFWGVSNGFGSNQLGEILMSVRRQLR